MTFCIKKVIHRTKGIKPIKIRLFADSYPHSPQVIHIKSTICPHIHKKGIYPSIKARINAFYKNSCADYLVNPYKGLGEHLAIRSTFFNSNTDVSIVGIQNITSVSGTVH